MLVKAVIDSSLSGCVILSLSLCQHAHIYKAVLVQIKGLSGWRRVQWSIVEHIGIHRGKNEGGIRGKIKGNRHVHTIQ